MKTVLKNILRPPFRFIKKIYRKLTSTDSLGYIFMLHRVDDFIPGNLWPNEHMKVSPDFLDFALNDIEKKFDVISIVDVPERLKQKNKRKFVVFTCDDGYKDNLTKALPVFKKHNLPFTIYITTNFPDCEAVLWWYELEDLLVKNSSVKLSNGITYPANTYEEKCQAFLDIRKEILKLNQQNLESELDNLFSDYKIKWTDKCKELCLSWQDIEKLKKESLVTIGGHTKHHYNLKQLASEKEVYNEVKDGCEKLAEKAGIIPEVFAYPFGSSNEAGEREFKVLEKFNFKCSVIADGDACNLKNCRNLNSIPRRMFTQDFNIRDLQ